MTSKFKSCFGAIVFLAFSVSYAASCILGMTLVGGGIAGKALMGEEVIRFQHDPRGANHGYDLRDNQLLMAAEWNHFDVLIRFDTFFGKQRKETDIGTTRFIRLALDANDRLAFCFQRFEFEDVSGNSDRPSVSDAVPNPNILPRSINSAHGRRIAANLLVVRDGSGVFYRFPGPRTPIGRGRATADESIFFFVNLCNIPDFRCLGASSFPMHIAEKCYFSNCLKAMDSPETIRERELQPLNVSYEDGIIVVSGSQEFPSPSGKYSMHWIRRYNSETFMPESSVTFMKQGSETFPISDESYEWTEIDGNYLPVSATVEAFHRDPTGTLLHSRYHTLELRWKAFRKPLDPSFFEDDLKLDMPRMMKLVEWKDEQ